MARRPPHLGPSHPRGPDPTRRPPVAGKSLPNLERSQHVRPHQAGLPPCHEPRRLTSSKRPLTAAPQHRSSVTSSCGNLALSLHPSFLFSFLLPFASSAVRLFLLRSGLGVLRGEALWGRPFDGSRVTSHESRIFAVCLQHVAEAAHGPDPDPGGLELGAQSRH